MRPAEPAGPPSLRYDSLEALACLAGKARFSRARVAGLEIVCDMPTAWLGRQDSNLGMAVPKTAALPLGDAPAVAPHSLPAPIP